MSTKDSGYDDGIEILDEDDLDVELDSGELDGDSPMEDATGAIAKSRLTKSIYSLMNKWREDDVNGLVADAADIDYKLMPEELNILSDFIVPEKAPQIIRALETSVASWFRLAFHMENVADLEQAAFNDLVIKKAKSAPDPETKKEKKYTDADRANIVEMASQEENDYYRRVKKVRKKLSILVSCIKEYINVLKKLLDYYNNSPSA